MDRIRLQGGNELHFLSFGEGNRGRGKTVLLVHGAGANGEMWRQTAKKLEPRHWALALDLPGHGGSTGPGGSSIEGYATQLEELIDLLGDTEVVVVGNSMGGAIALRLALDCPGKLWGIGLVGTGGRLRVLPEIFESIRADFPGAVKNIAGFALHPQSAPEAFALMEREIGRGTPEVLYDDFLACDRFDVLKEVPRIQLPVLVVCGRQDRLTPLKYAEFLAQSLPQATLRVIQECGHAPMVEHPERLAELLAEFLSQGCPA